VCSQSCYPKIVVTVQAFLCVHQGFENGMSNAIQQGVSTWHGALLNNNSTWRSYVIRPRCFVSHRRAEKTTGTVLTEFNTQQIWPRDRIESLSMSALAFALHCSNTTQWSVVQFCYDMLVASENERPQLQRRQSRALSAAQLAGRFGQPNKPRYTRIFE
jgi:hypothetical protein